MPSALPNSSRPHRRRLKEALLQAVTPNAVEMGDTAALHELLKVGGCRGACGGGIGRMRLWG